MQVPNAIGPSLPIALNSRSDAPEWIMLLPAGTVRTVDGRGPYIVRDADKLAAESLSASGGRLAIDENHATDLSAPKGGASPARGWIVELQARADGLWARVEWTKDGAALIAERAYRHISPVITHLKDGTITRVLRAALTNTPNLSDLAALNSEGAGGDLLAKLREALGLSDDATEDAVLTAVVTAVETIARAKGDAGSDQVKTLQAELVKTATQLTELQTSIATEKATAIIDMAIKEGRVGVKPLRDHYIARHAKEPDAVEKELAALPKLVPSGTTMFPPKTKYGELSLNAEQRQVAKLLGIPEDKYAATLATLKAEHDA